MKEYNTQQRLFSSFVTGLGNENSYFKSNDAATLGLKKSSLIQNTIQKSLKSGAAEMAVFSADLKNLSESLVPSFNAHLEVITDASPMQLFTGSARVSATKFQNGLVKVEVYNETTLTSLLFHINVKNHAREDGVWRPFSTIKQTYRWTQ